MKYLSIKRAFTSGQLMRDVIRSSRVQLLTEWRLVRRGRLDCQNGILRQIGDYFTSPFITQEASLCNAAMEAEKEFYARVSTNAQVSATTLSLAIERAFYTPTYPQLPLLNTACADAFEKEDNASDREAQGRPEAAHMHVQYYSPIHTTENQEILFENYKSLRERCHFLQSKEARITILRCNQLRELLYARIAAYWRGALRGDENSMLGLPPVFDISPVLCNPEEIFSKQFIQPNEGGN